VSLNHVRAIFLGHGEAGKTSLIRALHGEQVIKGDEAMTAGIEIREWPVPDTEILAHLWDFGGQVVFHSTHKFFLRSSCVYIIVINARASIDDSEQAEYWLDHVKAFGGSAPVLIVGNKADEARVNLQMQTLSQRYPNITGFYSISCTESKTNYQLQFDIFRQALAKELQAVSVHQMLFTPAQGKVLQELRQYSRDHAFLSEDEFNLICDKHEIMAPRIASGWWIFSTNWA
jgi:small GTP-binding protein